MALVTTDLGDLSFIGLQPMAPVTETLSWFTDVIGSYNGGEERLRLREHPRQSFAMGYVASPLQTPDVYNTVYGSLAGDWAIPVWGDAQYVGTLAEGATGAPVGGAAADLRAGGLALLWGVNGAYALVTLASVASGSVTFAALANTIRSAYLMPVRVGKITSPARKQTNGSQTKWSLVYNVDDQLDLTSAAPAQYNGNDIYYDAGLIADEYLDEEIKTQIDKNDYDIGVVKISSPWLYPRPTRDYAAMTSTPAASWALRLWLHRRCGKYRPFWQPTFENDLRIAESGTIGSTLTVKSDSWDTLASLKTHIAVETSAGWFPRKILTSSVLDDTVQLGLDSALAFAGETVKRISYLSLRRLDTDTVDLTWAAGICNTSFAVTELTP